MKHGGSKQMTLPTWPPVVVPVLSCPFVAGPMITDPRVFVGRQEELQYIVAHMTGVQPISVNVVGERRIGKSSLLFHFFQTWEQRVHDVSRYVVVYLSLQNAGCQNREGFYRAIARELLRHSRELVRGSLSGGLAADPFDHPAFATALEQYNRRGVLPVICLDEFQALLQHPNQFDDSFYDHLRSLMDGNSLMLVIASQKELDVYRHQHSLTSNFFNLGHVLHVGELIEEEAIDLVCLPASTMPGTRTALSLEEQRYARQWGGSHPYLLQLAAGLLCQARQQGRNIAWARKKFAGEKRRLPRSAPLIPGYSHSIVWLGRNFPHHLGHLSRRIGTTFNSVQTWITGVIIVIVVPVLVILIILGRIPITQFIQALLKLLGV